MIVTDIMIAREEYRAADAGITPANMSIAGRKRTARNPATTAQDTAG